MKFEGLWPDSWLTRQFHDSNIVGSFIFLVCPTAQQVLPILLWRYYLGKVPLDIGLIDVVESLEKVIDAIDALGGAVLEEVRALLLQVREIVDFIVAQEDEVVGASDHVKVLQSVILLA